MNQLTKIFKALSDDTRIEIVRHVAREKEIACQELMKRFPLSQPTMSHHFNKLVESGILNNRKDGVLWFYTLNTQYLKSLGVNIEKMVS
jgi:DNA-binding transcriptional ArsR family regulator